MPDDIGSEHLEFGAWSSPDERALIGAVAAHDPELAALVREHVSYHERVLSTLLLADVVRWANEQYANGRSAKVAGLLAMLEDRYEHGDRYVRDLIAVGFIESMDSSDQPAAGMRELLGPRLRSEYLALNY